MVLGGDTTLERIEWLIDAGAQLPELEALIERLPLSADEQAALWLVAWCKADQRASGYGEAHVPAGARMISDRSSEGGFPRDLLGRGDERPASICAASAAPAWIG